MSKTKKYLIIFGVTLIGVIFLSYLISLLPTREEEKENKKTDNLLLSLPYDVSTAGTIAYITYRNTGNPVIILYNKNSPEESSSFKVKDHITDMTFSTDGKKLFFVTNDEVSEERLQSTVYQLDIKEEKIAKVFQNSAIIQDIEVSNGGDELFYLRANNYQYLDLTGRVISDVDLYQYNLKSKRDNRVTYIETQEMKSLTVSSDGKSVFVSMALDNDEGIYQIQLQKPTKITKLFEAQESKPIYDFTVASSDNIIIYQIPLEDPEQGIYNYELFQYNRETTKTKQLTTLGEQSRKPKIVNENTLYFMVNTNLGKGASDFHLYRKFRFDGENEPAKELKLPNFEEFKNFLSNNNESN